MAESDPKKETSNSDDLKDEEKAAFDKIMAEIEGKDADAPTADPDPDDAATATEAPDEDSSGSDSGGDELSADELDTFKSIMAEIGGDADSEDTGSDAASESESESGAEDLGEDDFAAELAKVAEAAKSLNEEGESPATEAGDDDTPSDAPDDSSEKASEPEEEDTQELNPDELDAFNAIMAEINGGEPSPAEAEPPASAEPAASEEKTDGDAEEIAPDDFAAELEKVSQEAQKSVAGASEAADEAASPPDDPAPEAPSAQTEDVAEATPSPEPPASPEADVPEDEPAAPSAQSEETEPKAESQDISSTPAPKTSTPQEQKSAGAPEAVQEAEKKEENTTSETDRPRRNIAPLKVHVEPPKKRWKWVVAAGMAFLLIAGGVWTYYRYGETIAAWRMPEKGAPIGTFAPENRVNTDGAAEVIMAQPRAEEMETATPPVSSTMPALPPPSQQNVLALLKQEVDSMREEQLNKLEEIENLQEYYRTGIKEIRKEVIEAVGNAQYPSFEEAVKNKRMELSLRTIQRRMDYIEKLKVPKRQVYRRSEELLYLQRKAEILEPLMQKTSGIVPEPFKQEVDSALARMRASESTLSIDDVKTQPPALKTIWNTTLKAAFAKAEKVEKQSAEEMRNHAIWKEICEGDFTRKSELTEISADAAKCLAQWQGKDLYLNSVTRMSPETAKALSRWPGNWLGLNGLQTLSADAAKHFSRWQGNRLSLNGLKELSPKATAYLSQWQGEQLELISLKRIGNWENPDITLYLPDNLKQKLPAKTGG